MTNAAIVRRAPSGARLNKLRRRGSLRVLRKLVGIALLLCCLLPFLIENREPETIPGNRLYLGTIVLLLALLPAFLYLRQRRRPPIPFLPLVGLFYLASCGVPALYEGTLVASQFTQISTDALLAVICGLTSLYIAFYTSSATVFQTVSPVSFVPATSYRRLRLAACCLLLIHLFAITFPSIASALYITEFTTSAGYVSSGLILILWLRRRLGHLMSGLVLFVGIPIGFLARLASGSIAQVYILVLFLLIILWSERRRVPWTIIAVGTLSFFVMNTAKNQFRSLTWFSGLYANASTLEKAQLFLSLATGEVREDRTSETNRRQSFDASVSRLSQLGFLSFVMQQTPGAVPYWRGETYASLVYKLIPRVIWRDKPTEIWGVEFSRRYGMRSATDETTSFNVPWLVEMYANFGWLGVICGMSIVGLLFSYMQRKLNAPGMGIPERATGAAILIDLIAEESNLSLMIGAKLLILLSFYMFFHFLLGHESTRRRSRAASFGAPDLLAQPESLQALAKS